jgi:STE24 endopeptidase
LLVFVIGAMVGCVRTGAQISKTGAPAVSASSLIPTVRTEIIAYNRTQYILYFISTAWGFLGLVLVVRMGLGRRILNTVDRRIGVPTDEPVQIRPLWLLLRVAPYFAMFSLLMLVWRLPLGLCGYWVERSYGFATLSLPRWIGDRMTGYLFGLISIPAVWFGYWLIQKSPKRWWLWLWLASIPWTVAAWVIIPIMVDPVYNHFVPLPESPLKRDIVALASKAGIGGAQVFRVDTSKRTTKVNAYVTGIGPSKRIVIWDSTLNKLSHDEILAVLGHEMGHYVLNHMWRSVFTGTIGAFCLLYLLSRLLPMGINRVGKLAGIRGVSDPAGLPLALLLLSAMLFLQTPVENAILRYNEHEADRYGLELTHLNEATARAFAGFVEQNYSDPDPPKFIVFWLYSHPPIRERVEFALSYRQSGTLQ